MPRTSPYHIEPTDDERDPLEATARRYSSPHRDVARAKIVLLAAEGLPTTRSPLAWTPLAGSSPNGANGSTSNAWPASWSDREPDGPRLSPRKWS